MKILTILLVLFVVTGQFGSRAAAQEEKKEIETPAAEVVEIETKDRILLQCSWFGGTKGKETIPVLMLHDWGGSRKDLLDLAASLQKEYGFAVLVPDLRGHGESLNVAGSSEKLDTDKWKQADIASMIRDIEACKSFFKTKNDDGELNVDMMSLLAVGNTCIHAIQWSVTDWSYGPIGGVEQGQDVKSIVLMGPVKSFRSLNLTKTIRNPLFTGEADYSLSMMILGNTDNSTKSVRESKSIYKSIKRMRKENDDGKNFLHYFEYQTKRQAKVVESKNGDVELPEVIGYFITNESERFENDHRWQSRKRN